MYRSVVALCLSIAISANGKVAGVWPDQYDANMSIAPSQPFGPTLHVDLRARLRYDVTKLRQHWEYYDLDSGAKTGGELWVGHVMYSYDADECFASNFTFGIVGPTWLQQTNYTTTNHLIRQASKGYDGQVLKPEEENIVGYTLGDLFQFPNSLGMTNSWLVADSEIAEPIRLEGPDDFSNPDHVSVLEYASFVPVDSFNDAVFDIPDVCKDLHDDDDADDAAPKGGPTCTICTHAYSADTDGDGVVRCIVVYLFFMHIKTHPTRALVFARAGLRGPS